MSERGKRRWLLKTDDYESEDAFRRAVQDELVGLENIGHRLGGGFLSSPIRQEMTDEHGFVDYVTVAWLFEHTFVPAVRQRVPASDEDMEAVALAERQITDLVREPEPAEA